MLRICPIFLFLLCFAFTVSKTQAHTVTNQKLIALEKAVFAYSQAIQNADVNAILNAIPPQIINSLIAKKNLGKSQFRKIMKNQIEQLKENYKIESIHIDQKQKREGKLDNGTPYFVMPVNFITTTNTGEKRSIQTEVIALLYNNQWYFLHGNDKAILEISSEILPGLKEIEINRKKVKKMS
ncbi:hypothetical protein [Bartonella sp. CB169]|uniref:hypothetical protein n=1 Tax=Bartonella sp. CB169 TaxID=3112257 RepID=UPI00300DEFC8